MTAKKIKKTQAKNRIRSSKKSRFNALFLLILFIGLIVFLIYIFFNTDTGGNYSKLKNVSSNSNKYQLMVPEQMIAVESGDEILDYEDPVKGDQGGLLSHIRIEPQFIAENISQKTKEDIYEQFKSQKGEYYDIFSKKLNSGPLANELKFGDFYDYQSENIQKAISAEFIYVSDGVPTSGRLLMVLDNQSMYFVIAEATDKVWDDNQDIWNKVFESFKINI